METNKEGGLIDALNVSYDKIESKRYFFYVDIKIYRSGCVMSKVKSMVDQRTELTNWKHFFFSEYKTGPPIL